jgi:hypothetical protein
MQKFVGAGTRVVGFYRHQHQQTLIDRPDYLTRDFNTRTANAL